MAAKKAKNSKAKGTEDGKDKGKVNAKRLSNNVKRLSENIGSPDLVEPAEPPKLPTLPPPPPPKPDVCDLYLPDECLVNVTCRFNDYPTLIDKPKPMSIVGSETGKYESLCGLLKAGLRCADRVLLMVPWGNYVVFRANKPNNAMEPITEELTYFLYDGCTCNVNSFRHLDLRGGAAGFITFPELDPLIAYIIGSRYKREKLGLLCNQVLDDICTEKRPTGEEELAEEGEKV